MSYTYDQMQAIFAPRTIALVLGSENNPGLHLLQGLLARGFKGEVFPVSRNANELIGLKTYADVGSVPAEVDLAVVLEEEGQLPRVIDDCARKKVKVAIIFAACPPETGNSAGHERVREIISLARSGNVRLLGPNSMGAYCSDSHLCLVPSMAANPGSAAFISQGNSSGAFAALMGSHRGIGFNKVVSTGDECDLTTSDFLEYLAKDEKTKVVMAHLESAHDGRVLLRGLKEASVKKPVIIWKTGAVPGRNHALRLDGKASAAAEAVLDAALRQAGAIRAYDVEEMVDIATAFYYLPESTGRRVSIISGPGGPAVAAADALEKNGLQPGVLAEESLEKLRKFVPPAGASLKNPIDLGVAPWAIITLYTDTLKVVDEDDGVDATLLIGGGITATTQEEYLELMLGLRKDLKKPCMVITWAGLRGDLESPRKLQEAGYPLYASPERAMVSYSKLVAYYEWRNGIARGN